MSSSPDTTYSFTKLVVGDLEKMRAFYSDAYGLEQLERIQAEIREEAIDEIILGKSGEMAGGVILLAFVDRPPPVKGEIILGFTTDDLDAQIARVLAAGGALHAPARQHEGSPYRVAFLTDPEGHLAEVVETNG